MSWNLRWQSIWRSWDMGHEHRKFVEGIGYIPTDWMVKTSDEISIKITKGTTPPKADIVTEKEIPFLRVNNLGFNGDLDKKSEFIYVTRSAHDGFLARSKAYAGDILMNIVGPPLGKVSLLGDEFAEYNMNQAIVIFRLNNNEIHRDFFLAFLLSEKAQQWLQSRSKKTSGQQNLTIEVCKGLPVPIPSLKEQKKIAKILSNWDKAITTTEQLLANSQQQKKALMQQLLTGKKRLLDKNGVRFSGEWNERLLGEISQITTGSSNRQDSHMNGAYTFFDRSEDIRTSDTYLFDCEAVIVPGEGQDFVPKYFKGKFDLHQRTYAIMNFPKDNGKFLFYAIHYFRTHFLSQAVGSTVKSLRLPMFQKMKLNLPSFEEQQKIATVLSIADEEITALRNKLDALTQEKKALMQQLLTGKRRVTLNDEKSKATNYGN